MNNPYTPEFNYLYLNDLNREAIERKDEKAQAKVCQIKNITVTDRFKNTFLNNWKEKAKNGIQ